MTRAKPWHKRWHGNALNGMRGLSLELRGAYQTLLDLMYDNEGPVRLDERRQSAEMDCDLRVFRRVIGALIKAEKLRLWSDGRTVWLVNDKVLEVLGEEGFAADTSAELVAEVREKFAISNAELSPKSAGKRRKNNEPENRTVEKTDARGERKEEEPPKPPQGAGQLVLLSDDVAPDPVRQAFDLWNETAARCDLPKAEDLTDRRRTAIGKRLEGGGLNRWRRALSTVERSRLCRGMKPGRDGGAPWRATIDFVASPSGFQKLVEGAYAADIAPPAGPVPAASPDVLWRKRVGAFKRDRFWNETDWGPQPGQPDCKAPPAILTEFDYGPARSAA